MFCFSFWDNTFKINDITDHHITWCNRNPKINVIIPYVYPEVFKSNEIHKKKQYLPFLAWEIQFSHSRSRRRCT